MWIRGVTREVTDDGGMTIGELPHDIDTLKHLVLATHQQVVERDQQLAQREEQIVQRDQQLAQREEQIVRRDQNSRSRLDN